MFDIDTQICNYQDVVTNCDREGKVPECTDELRDNSVCRETEQSQSESLDLLVSINLTLTRTSGRSAPLFLVLVPLSV